MADKNPMKYWTIMVYMAGDNNLSTEMVYALEQIKSVKNNYIDLYVYFDGLSGDVPTLYCDFSDPINSVNFYQSSKIKHKLIDVKDEFNENSSAVNNIINFIDWCVRKDTEEERKEKKYAFVFSGHSIGFLNWGLFKDAKADYYMTHAKLQYMFERVTSDQDALNKKAEADERRHVEKYKKPWSKATRSERTTVILGKQLDLLGFDSCVMSSLEIGSQFQEYAKYMVASEGSIPTSGWNYAQILLGRLNENPRSAANEIAISFVDEFVKQQNKFALADISIDMSAWDLGVLEKNVKPAFLSFVDALDKCFPDGDEKNTTYQQMRRLIVCVHSKCQTYMLEQNVDLVDFCALLIEEIDQLETELSGSAIGSILKVREECKKVIDSIRECILLTGFSGGDFQFSNGISLFFPWSLASYESAEYDYKNLRFIKDEPGGVKWNEFLIKYLGDVTFRHSRAVTETGNNGKFQEESVVYESYANLSRMIESGEDWNDQTPGEGKQPPNSGKQPPNSGKQPPNSGRQPPNSGRQPPNSGRMIDDMSIFLSRFMRLKNFEFNWNRTGFRSKHVTFRSQIAAARPAEDEVVIDIPRPRTIQDRIQQLLDKLSAFAKGNKDNKNIQIFLTWFEKILLDSDESTAVVIMKTIEESGDEISEERLFASLKRAVDISAADKDIKAELESDLKKLGSRGDK